MVRLRVLVIRPVGSSINQQSTSIDQPLMLISLTINLITDQLRNEQMSLPRFEPGSFMTERERSHN
jgi:hypothetical protein